LAAFLKQEVAFFELQSIEQLPSQIGEDFAVIQAAIGAKIGSIIFGIFVFIGGIGIALFRGSVLAGICLSYLPLMLVVVAVFGGQVKKSTNRKREMSKKLGGIVEESLSAIKLIVSFAQEKREVDKFAKLAEENRDVSQKEDMYISAFLGLVRGMVFGFYAFAFYVGSRLI
jgi:ABC-type multidrug transport system fused ATPase/permease subunit